MGLKLQVDGSVKITSLHQEFVFFLLSYLQEEKQWSVVSHRHMLAVVEWLTFICYWIFGKLYIYHHIMLSLQLVNSVFPDELS